MELRAQARDSRARWLAWPGSECGESLVFPAVRLGSAIGSIGCCSDERRRREGLQCRRSRSVRRSITARRFPWLARRW